MSNGNYKPLGTKRHATTRRLKAKRAKADEKIRVPDEHSYYMDEPKPPPGKTEQSLDDGATRASPLDTGAEINAPTVIQKDAKMIDAGEKASSSDEKGDQARNTSQDNVDTTLSEMFKAIEEKDASEEITAGKSDNSAAEMTHDFPSESKVAEKISAEVTLAQSAFDDTCVISLITLEPKKKNDEGITSVNSENNAANETCASLLEPKVAENKDDGDTEELTSATDSASEDMCVVPSAPVDTEEKNTGEKMEAGGDNSAGKEIIISPSDAEDAKNNDNAEDITSDDTALDDTCGIPLVIDEAE